ncbi:MAG: hypothetical protein LKM45_02580 [Wolbachia endosymbiont of Alcedoecus sp.]|nr:hypothetical protein [Wolbachia endosymbiont of Alcedoecus sp.]
MSFEIRSKVLVSRGKNEEGGRDSTLIGGSDKSADISIKKTFDKEKAEYMCRLVINHLLKQNVKMTDLKMIDTGDTIEIRKKD